MNELGRGGYIVVRILAFYYNDLSLNRLDYLFLIFCSGLKKTLINEKEAGIGPYENVINKSRPS